MKPQPSEYQCYKKLLKFPYTAGWVISIILFSFVGVGLLSALAVNPPVSAKIVMSVVGSIFCLFGIGLIGYKTYLRKQFSFLFKGIGIKNESVFPITEKQLYEIILVVCKILCIQCNLYDSIKKAETVVLKSLKSCVIAFVPEINVNAYNEAFGKKYKEINGYCFGRYLCIVPVDPLVKSTLIHEIFHRLIDTNAIDTIGLDSHTWMKVTHVDDESYLNKLL